MSVAGSTTNWPARHGVVGLCRAATDASPDTSNQLNAAVALSTLMTSSALMGWESVSRLVRRVAW